MGRQDRLARSVLTGLLLSTLLSVIIFTFRKNALVFALGPVLGLILGVLFDEICDD